MLRARRQWPLATRAQQAMLIGYLSGLSVGDRPVLLEAFHRGLGVAGYAAGRNVEIEFRYADSQTDRLQCLVNDLIARRVAVIVATGGNNAGLVAKALTSTIPIVFTSGLDPVQAGLVNSLSRPEGNVTGVSFFTVDRDVGTSDGFTHAKFGANCDFEMQINCKRATAGRPE